MSIDQTTLAARPAAGDPQAAAPFDLVAFGRALTVGDLGYQLARYAAGADIRITTDTPSTAPRLVSGTSAISAWLHESASSEAPSVVSHLIDGGDRVAFTRNWRELDGRSAVSVSTAELKGGLITVQHTIVVRSREPDAGVAGE